MSVTPQPLGLPRIHLVRMAVFLVLAGFLAFILYKPLTAAFLANPALNGLILGVLLIGIALAIRQVFRLFREVRWVNAVAQGLAGQVHGPVLLAPMAALITSSSKPSLTMPALRSLLDSVAARLDENRELVRYLAGLLVFLGLLGTFWGLIETVSSVGRVIGSLRTGPDAGVLFDELKNSLAAPLAGMGISFSSSLFGLAGSLVLGFLDLQAGQAQNRFYTELEDWLAAALTTETRSEDLSAATQALSTLAEGVQGLIRGMRSEQQMVRDWIEAQAAREKDFLRILERLTRERV